MTVLAYDFKTLTLITSGISSSSLLMGAKDGQSDSAPDPITVNALGDYYKSLSQTLTNKTFDTAGTGNVLKINGTTVSDKTGTGKVVLDTSPTLVSPLLGTPTSGVLSSCTGLPLTTGITGTLGAANGGTGIANNAASTLAISGNFATTLTISNTTSVTLPTSGTLATLAGSEALTNKSYNGLTLTATTGTFTLTNAKTFAVAKSLTLDGTDSTTMTFPSTSASIARTDAGQTFTGASTITSWIANTVDARGTWTAGATWTLPAHTLGGTVSGGGNQINNVIIGTSTPLAGSFTTLAASGLISANGGQIAFPASQNASANANTLDDYEEGTWTPALTFATPGDLSVAYTGGFQHGEYTKIGRLVQTSFIVVLSTFTFTTASGALQITGLPFTSTSTTNYRAYATAAWAGITKANYTSVPCVVADSTTLLTFPASGSGQAISTVVAADMPSAGSPVIAGAPSYIV